MLMLFAAEILKIFLTKINKHRRSCMQKYNMHIFIFLPQKPLVFHLHGIHQHESKSLRQNTYKILVNKYKKLEELFIYETRIL